MAYGMSLKEFGGAAVYTAAGGGAM